MERKRNVNDKMIRTEVPKVIYRRGGETYKKVYRSGKVEHYEGGKRTSTVYPPPALTEEQKIQQGYLSGRYYRVYPEDIEKYGSVEKAIEAQKARDLGFTGRDIERQGRFVEAYEYKPASAGRQWVRSDVSITDAKLSGYGVAEYSTVGGQVVFHPVGSTHKEKMSSIRRAKEVFKREGTGGLVMYKSERSRWYAGDRKTTDAEQAKISTPSLPDDMISKAIWRGQDVYFGTPEGQEQLRILYEVKGKGYSKVKKEEPFKLDYRMPTIEAPPPPKIYPIEPEIDTGAGFDLYGAIRHEVRQHPEVYRFSKQQHIPLVSDIIESFYEREGGQREVMGGVARSEEQSILAFAPHVSIPFTLLTGEPVGKPYTVYEPSYRSPIEPVSLTSLELEYYRKGEAPLKEQWLSTAGALGHKGYDKTYADLEFERQQELKQEIREETAISGLWAGKQKFEKEKTMSTEYLGSLEEKLTGQIQTVERADIGTVFEYGDETLTREAVKFELQKQLREIRTQEEYIGGLEYRPTLRGRIDPYPLTAISGVLPAGAGEGLKAITSTAYPFKEDYAPKEVEWLIKESGKQYKTQLFKYDIAERERYWTHYSPEAVGAEAVEWGMLGVESVGVGSAIGGIFKVGDISKVAFSAPRVAQVFGIGATGGVVAHGADIEITRATGNEWLGALGGTGIGVLTMGGLFKATGGVVSKMESGLARGRMQTQLISDQKYYTQREIIEAQDTFITNIETSYGASVYTGEIKSATFLGDELAVTNVHLTGERMLDASMRISTKPRAPIFKPFAKGEELVRRGASRWDRWIHGRPKTLDQIGRYETKGVIDTKIPDIYPAVDTIEWTTKPIYYTQRGGKMIIPKGYGAEVKTAEEAFLTGAHITTPQTYITYEGFKTTEGVYYTSRTGFKKIEGMTRIKGEGIVEDLGDIGGYSIGRMKSISEYGDYMGKKLIVDTRGITGTRIIKEEIKRGRAGQGLGELRPTLKEVYPKQKPVGVSLGEQVPKFKGEWKPYEITGRPLSTTKLEQLQRGRIQNVESMIYETIGSGKTRYGELAGLGSVSMGAKELRTRRGVVSDVGLDRRLDMGQEYKQGRAVQRISGISAKDLLLTQDVGVGRFQIPKMKLAEDVRLDQKPDRYLYTGFKMSQDIVPLNIVKPKPVSIQAQSMRTPEIMIPALKPITSVPIPPLMPVLLGGGGRKRRRGKWFYGFRVSHYLPEFQLFKTKGKKTKKRGKRK